MLIVRLVFRGPGASLALRVEVTWSGFVHVAFLTFPFLPCCPDSWVSLPVRLRSDHSPRFCFPRDSSISCLLTGKEPEVERCEKRWSRSHGRTKMRMYICDLWCNSKGRKGERNFKFIWILFVLRAVL